MELRYRILAYRNSPRFELLQSQLRKLGCEYEFHENGNLSWIEYILSEHEPFAGDLVSFAQSNDILIQSFLHYEEDEISSAEWVIAEVGEFQYPQPEDGYIQATYDTRDFCPRCGQGKYQNRPFRLKRDFSQKQAKFLGLHWVFDEIFVRPVIRDIFEAAEITGLGYREVLHDKTGERLANIFQLEIPVIPEPAVIVDDLFPVTCRSQNQESLVKRVGHTWDRPQLPFCGRVKYHFPVSQSVQIRADILKGLPDFVETCEYFGSGALAFHLILVRSKVAQLVKEKGIEGLSFRRPVHLV